jgi:hypothetical protein
MGVSFGGRGKFAREQLAQHVGDGDAAPEGGDLDAAAQLGRDVDGQPRGERRRRAVAGWRRIGALIQLRDRRGGRRSRDLTGDVRSWRDPPDAQPRSRRQRRDLACGRAVVVHRLGDQPAGLRGGGEGDALADGGASTGGSWSASVSAVSRAMTVRAPQRFSTKRAASSGR